MKKLFTLIALVACVMTASAKEIVDKFIDFSTVTEIPRFSWGGSESAFARLSLVDGCLHFHNEAAVDPSWDVQFFPIGGVDAEVGVTYTLHFKVKGTVNQNVSMLGFGVTPYGQFPITTEWVEGTFDYVCEGANGDLLMQCGDYVGDWDIAYLKITHEGREERPITWIELLNNGNAEKSWEELGLDPHTKAGDAENNTKICFWTKEKGTYDDNEPKDGTSGDAHPAEIVTEADGNHAFICRATLADTEGDPSAWDNQIWIESPRAWKAGEQFKLSFRYKASQPVKTNTQVHRQSPGDYLHYVGIGDITFETNWKTFEEIVTVSADQAGMYSVAFNLNPNVKEPVDFYIDDLSWSQMQLEEGLFVAGKNNTTGLVDYDYDTAIPFEYDEEAAAWYATIGTVGKQDSWVDELMISTVRGNDRQFKANTIKMKSPVTGDPETWVNFEEGPSAKIKLPAQGVWTIYVDRDANVALFMQEEGDPIKAPIDIKPNPTVITINAVEREMTIDEAKEAGLVADKDNPTDEEKALYCGQPWDNQFMIMSNMPLKTGDETIIEFDYVAEKAAKSNTQCGGSEPGAYIYWNCIGDVDFTTEEQHFTKEYKVPSGDNNSTITTQSITFNLAVLKEANVYTIKNVVWKLADSTETLINMEGDENFYVKTGANTAPMIPSGIINVANKTVAPSVIYNLAGQRVSNSFKGIVVKNGAKFVVK